MSSIDLDNLETAKRLAVHYQIRHVPINFLTMMIVDNRVLLIFRNPPMKESRTETPFYAGDTFYTDDSLTVERSSEMLNDIWKRGIEISELDSQAGIKLPTVSVSSEGKISELVDAMLKNSVEAILITENQKPIGIVTERDILKEIAKLRTNLNNIPLKDLNYTPMVEMENLKSLLSTMRKSHREGLTRIAIVKNGQLVGMLTENLGKKQASYP